MSRVTKAQHVHRIQYLLEQDTQKHAATHTIVLLCCMHARRGDVYIASVRTVICPIEAPLLLRLSDGQDQESRLVTSQKRYSESRMESFSKSRMYDDQKREYFCCTVVLKTWPPYFPSNAVFYLWQAYFIYPTETTISCFFKHVISVWSHDKEPGGIHPKGLIRRALKGAIW